MFFNLTDELINEFDYVSFKKEYMVLRMKIFAKIRF